SDWARKISCTPQGCAIFGHTIKSFGETTDYFAMMESPQGEILWARTYGGTHRDQLRAASAAADGYLMAGSSQSLFFTALKVINPNRPPRPFLLRIDEAGNPRWAATFDS